MSWLPCFCISRLIVSLGKKIDSEREQIEKEIRETEKARKQLEESLFSSSSKIARLRTQLDIVEGRKRDLVSRELASIDELDRFEAESPADAAHSSSDSPPIRPVPRSPDLSLLD